jgi:hypothetical protein
MRIRLRRGVVGQDKTEVGNTRVTEVKVECAFPDESEEVACGVLWFVGSVLATAT